MSEITFDYSKLEGRIKEKYDTQSRLACTLGMSKQALSARLNNRTPFTQTEIRNLTELLDIPDEEMKRYFFTVTVWKNEQKKEEVN